MDEFVCLTMLSEPGETEAAFKLRIVSFWTHMLRNHPDEYEQVYAEARDFETHTGRVTRQYMVRPEIAELLQQTLTSQKIAAEPIDLDDTYNKAEASSSEWFQIPHD
jgi:hypothetical protein